jgi:hypothetical protein
MNGHDIALAHGMLRDKAASVAAVNNANDDVLVYLVVERADGAHVIGVCEAADGYFLGWL